MAEAAIRLRNWNCRPSLSSVFPSPTASVPEWLGRISDWDVYHDDNENIVQGKQLFEHIGDCPGWLSRQRRTELPSCRNIFFFPWSVRILDGSPYACKPTPYLALLPQPPTNQLVVTENINVNSLPQWVGTR